MTWQELDRNVLALDISLEDVTFMKHEVLNQCFKRKGRVVVIHEYKEKSHYNF